MIIYIIVLIAVALGGTLFGLWLGIEKEASIYDPATKKDLAAAEARIIAAFGERIDPARIARLKQAVADAEEIISG